MNVDFEYLRRNVTKQIICFSLRTLKHGIRCLFNNLISHFTNATQNESFKAAVTKNRHNLSRFSCCNILKIAIEVMQKFRKGKNNDICVFFVPD